MCQVAVYLDEEKIMESVLLVEPVPEGVRLVKLFEPPLVVPAVIRQVDLMKNRLFLESIPAKPAAAGTGDPVADPLSQWDTV
jgi:predicted RNA-binding protein